MLALAQRSTLQPELASSHGRMSDIVQTSPAQSVPSELREIAHLIRHLAIAIISSPRRFHLSPKLTYVFPEDLCW